jgi:spore germination protein YaaH
MISCPLGHQEAGLAPHCDTAQGEVWFENVASVTEKAQLARSHGLRGVALYSMGDEPPGLLDAMKAQFGN